MNKDDFSGQWNNIKAKAQAKWNKLTPDDISQVNGRRDQLLSAIQKRYGIQKDRANQELEAWEDTLPSQGQQQQKSQGQGYQSQSGIPRNLERPNPAGATRSTAPGQYSPNASGKNPSQQQDRNTSQQRDDITRNSKKGNR